MQNQSVLVDAKPSIFNGSGLGRRAAIPSLSQQITGHGVCTRTFRITGLTWIVERTFARLGRNRRLSKDYEYAVQSSETMIDIAAIRLMLNRLTAP